MMRRVREFMHRDFIRVSPEESLLDVVRLMHMARVRILPVVEGGRLAGIVSHRELARAAIERAAASQGKIEGSIAPFVRAAGPVSPEATLLEAAHRMLGDAVPCLAAVEPEGSTNLVGLLTEGDLLRAAYQSPSPVPPA